MWHLEEARVSTGEALLERGHCRLVYVTSASDTSEHAPGELTEESNGQHVSVVALSAAPPIE